MRVTQQQLIDILENTDANNVTLLYETPVKMNKRNNPFFVQEGRAWVQQNSVTKRVVDTFGFGLNYTDEVNKELKSNGAEANYQAGEVSWAETIVPNKVIKHKGTGKYYIKIFRSSIANHPVVERTVEYFVDGEPATDEQMRIIEEFEVKTDGNVKKQETAGLSNENQVKMQTIAFDNIISIVVDNTMYELK